MENLLKILLRLWEVMQTPLGWAAAVIAYFAPLGGVFWLILLIVFADFMSGMVASHKRKIPRSSRRFRKSLEKMLCYFGVIYLFWEFETQIGIQEWICTYKMIAGFIFIVEIISILENMAVITEQKVFLSIIKVIRGKAAQTEKEGSLVDDILNEKNNER